jgi:hypothetical protein
MSPEVAELLDYSRKMAEQSLKARTLLRQNVEQLSHSVESLTDLILDLRQSNERRLNGEATRHSRLGTADLAQPTRFDASRAP